MTGLEIALLAIAVAQLVAATGLFYVMWKLNKLQERRR